MCLFLMLWMKRLLRAFFWGVTPSNLQEARNCSTMPFELNLPQRPSRGSLFNQQIGYDG